MPLESKLSFIFPSKATICQYFSNAHLLAQKISRNMIFKWFFYFPPNSFDFEIWKHGFVEFKWSSKFNGRGHSSKICPKKVCSALGVARLTRGLIQKLLKEVRSTKRKHVAPILGPFGLPYLFPN